MAKLDYDFKRDTGKTQQQNELRNRRIRLTLLFCIVAAITAVVIFAIIPSSGSKVKVSENETKIDKTDSHVETGKTTDGNQNTDAEKEKSIDESKLAETVSPLRSGKSDPDAEQKLRAELNTGDFKKFFETADKLISATATDSEARARLGAILNEGRQKAWQSGKWKSCATEYRVVAGDYPMRIAQRHHAALEGLLLGNNLTRKSRIGISQRLYIIPGPWKVIVSRKAQLLTLLQKEKIFAVFKVALDAKKPLPSGEFTIRRRVKSPTYIDQHGRHFKNNDKANMLGKVMIFLRRKNGRNENFGFHGVAAQNKAIRSRCIQMNNDDILMLYNLLPVSTPVEIVD